MTRELILGTAGHIDHGKTALIKALTGVDTDRLAEEKERGISIDIGFAHLDVPGCRIGIVDVPGHERFIKNMLAGASGIDVALLVVAADDSVMPQTREHLAILELLDVRAGVIAITKADLAEAAWLDLVEEDVRALARGTFLESAPIVRTSATTGAGLETLAEALRAAAERHVPREDAGHFRMSIDRAFVLQGLGTLVTGTVASGVVSVGDTVEWLPVGRTLRVRSIQSHGEDADRVGPGRRAALDVTGAHHSEIHRGHVVAAPDHLAPSRLVTVHFRVLEASPWPIKHRSRVRLYVGTQEVIARVSLLAGTVVAPGERALAQLMCDEPVVAVTRQPFVLRSESPLRTIGGGTILQPAAPRLSRRDAASIARVTGLEDDDAGVRTATAIYFADTAPWTPRTLCRDAGVAPDRIDGVLAALERDGTISTLDLGAGRKVALHRDRYERLCERIRSTLERLHAASPLAAAIPRQRVAAALSYVEGDVVAGVIERMRGESLLTGDDAAIALPERKPVLTEAQRQTRERILAAYRDAGFSPPEPAKVAAAAGITADRTRALIDLCTSEGELVHLEGEMYLHREWSETLMKRIADELSRSDGLTVSQIKAHLGTSRKFAVPMCEYLDRIGVTKRRGDVRVLTGNA